MRWTLWDHPAALVCTIPDNRQFRCGADDAGLVPIVGSRSAAFSPLLHQRKG
jgi:hypothetical protein